MSDPFAFVTLKKIRTEESQLISAVFFVRTPNFLTCMKSYFFCNFAYLTIITHSHNRIGLPLSVVLNQLG